MATTIRIIRMKVDSQGRPDDCVNSTDWMHQHTCKVPACIDWYKRLAANTKNS